MDTPVARQTLHQLIDQTKDAELSMLCVQLLEREVSNTASKEQDFFNTSTENLISRAEASLASVSAGRTRNIQEFKKEVDQGKRTKSM